MSCMAPYPLVIEQARGPGTSLSEIALGMNAIYAFLTAGTGIPAILRFTEPRKFQLVK
jgi:hypothetical protein